VCISLTRQVFKRFTAPRQIKTTFQFIIAMAWTFIYIILIRVVGLDMTLFIRKPKALTTEQKLPSLQSNATGLLKFFEALQQKDMASMEQPKRRGTIIREGTVL
jgi:hypothetical protein